MDRVLLSLRLITAVLAVLAACVGGARPGAAQGPPPASGTPNPIRSGYERIDRGDATGAYEHFRTLAERDSGDLAAAFGTLSALETRGLDEPETQREFERRAGRLLGHARGRYERDRTDKEALFYLALGHGTRAIYRYKHDKGLWGAARDAAQSKRYGGDYRRLDAGRDDIYFVLGFYNYYIDIAPAFLKFLQPLLGLPGGDRGEGLRQLERAARDGDLLRTSALYDLVDIYMLEGRPEDALRIAERLHRDYPESPRAGHALAGSCLASAVGEYGRAEQVLLAMLQRTDQGHPHYRSEERYGILLSLAQARRQQWRIEEAAATLTPVIQAAVGKPDWVLPRFLLARGAYRTSLDEPQAAEDARRILAEKKWAGRWHKQAKEQLDRIAEERKSGESSAFADLIPANRLVAEQRWDEADAGYRHLRQRRPDDWQVRYRQAYLGYARDSLDRALADFRGIVHSSPGVKPVWVRAGAMLYLARTHDLLGQRPEALRYYKMVVSEYEKAGTAMAARMGLLAPYRRIAR